MKLQLEEAKTTATNAFSEYQSLVDMLALKQTIHDEAYKEATEAFVYTIMTTHLD